MYGPSYLCNCVHTMQSTVTLLIAMCFFMSSIVLGAHKKHYSCEKCWKGCLNIVLKRICITAQFSQIVDIKLTKLQEWLTKNWHYNRLEGWMFLPANMDWNFKFCKHFHSPGSTPRYRGIFASCCVKSVVKCLSGNILMIGWH